jgi:hypothetical protein
MSEESNTRTNDDGLIEYQHSDKSWHLYEEDPEVAKLREGGTEHVSREDLEGEIERTNDLLDPEGKKERDKGKIEGI